MTSEDNGDLESFVASQYELVRRILEPLTDLDLEACEKVNTLWANAVKAERNSNHRRVIQMFSWKGKAQTTRYYAQFDLQGSENHKDLYDSLKKWREERKMKPNVSLTISVGDPLGGPDDTQNFLADPFRVSELLGSRNIQIASGGVVIAPNGESPFEVENLSGSKETPVLGSIVFPKYGQNVQITPFSYFENEKIPSTAKDMNCSSLKELLGRNDVNGEEVKCIVFMSNVLDIKRTKLVIQTLGNITKRNVAVGGCIGNLAHDSADSSTYANLKEMLQAMETYTENEPGKYAQTVGVLFSGSGVKAASVLLTTPLNTQAKVEQELKKLKGIDFNEKRSCAFMFACCGRGKTFFKGKPNVESEVFKQLYPNTPLLGIFGNGEIGLTYLPDKNVKDTFSDPSASKKQKKDCGLLQAKEFSHSFTTVFVMLSF